MRREFDRRVNRNVRKSSTFRCEPLLDTVDHGEVVLLVDRWRGFFCGAFTYVPIRLLAEEIRRTRILP